jgi:hypothetical protein
MPSFVATKAEIAQHVSLTLGNPSEPIAGWGPSLDVPLPGSIPTAAPGDVPSDIPTWVQPVDDTPAPPPPPLPEPSIVEPTTNIIQSFNDSYFDDSFDFGDFGSYNTGHPNWAGAVIPADPAHALSTISADFTASTKAGAVWVGLDGYGSSDVAQAGLVVGPNGTVSAFNEWAPAGSQTIAATDFKVNPGDTIRIPASASGAGADTAHFLYDNLTTGQTYATSLTAPAGTTLTGSSAEAVEEFGSYKTNITDISAGYSDGTSASLSNAVPLSTMHAYGSVHPDTSSVIVMPHHS